MTKPIDHETSSEADQIDLIDDWIEAYENHLVRGDPAPADFPVGLSEEDHQLFAESRRAVDALHHAFDSDSTSAEQPAEESPPQQLGDFRILGEIGRGGMGVVYEAEQISLPRRVALKILPFAAVLDPRQLERFKNEARAAATLHHAGIVAVYSVGTERGVHFFAMEFIEGQSLAEVIHELQPDSQRDKETADCAADGTKPNKLPASTSSWQSQVAGDSTQKQAFFHLVARWGAQAAVALDHAHNRGIVHRDIKPGNLMLDTEGQVHVADFGLARMGEDAGVTMTGDVLGTLRYMSPEQALARRAVIDHRTDIYSLGATLYELLTLRPLFKGRDRQEMLRKIAQEEPQQPSKLNAKIPVDLETIVLKAISKDPTDRYDTAQAMADDLYRFIDGKPVQARRINAGQRLWRWSKRNPTVAVLSMSVAALATLVAIVALIGYARTSLALVQVSEERDAAQVARQDAQQKGHEAQQRDKALQNLYVSQMNMAQKDWDDGQIARLKKTLLSYLPLPGEPDLRGWEWYFHLSRCFGEAKTLRGHNFGSICSLVWSPDGTSLASARYRSFPKTGEIKLWNLETDTAIETLPNSGINGCLFAWHPGERRLAWRVDGSQTAMVVQHGESQVTIDLGAKLWLVAWSPDGNRIASNGPNKTVIV